MTRENEQGTYQGQEERARERTKIWSKEKDKFWEGLSGAGEETTDILGAFFLRGHAV
jgi:hypothetical protein